MPLRPPALATALAALVFLSACDSSDVSNEDMGDEAPEYNRAYITSFTQLSMPFANEQGQAWDTFSGPDVMYVLYDANDVEVARGTTFDDITPQALPLRWTLAPEYEVTDFDKTYYIAIYDEDLTGFEVIAETDPFRLRDLADDGFATEATFRNGNGTLEGRIALRWAE